MNCKFLYLVNLNELIFCLVNLWHQMFLKQRGMEGNRNSVIVGKFVTKIKEKALRVHLVQV